MNALLEAERADQEALDAPAAPPAPSPPAVQEESKDYMIE